MAQRTMTAAPAMFQPAPAALDRPGSRIEPSRVRWWVAALAIFAGSRVVTTLLFVWVQGLATPQSRMGAHPSLLNLATAWDGTWYWYVAANGYPSTLPVDASGATQTNGWAFLPAYPFLVKALSFGSTASWPLVAVLVSVAFGFGSAVLLAVLLRPRLGDEPAIVAVAVFSVSPLSFVLQMAYAESMALFLLLAALCLLDRQRYLAAIPVVLLLAFTRPGVLAFALAVVLHLLARVRSARRGADDLPRRRLVEGGLLALVSTLAGFAWPVVVALRTGVPDGYFRTEAAWRAIWLGDHPFAFVSPWFDAAGFWTGQWFGQSAAGVLGPLLVLIVVTGFTLLLLSPPVRRLGGTVRAWSVAYGLYLLAVFFPQSSVFRLLMPFAPLAGAAVPRSTGGRVAVLAAAVALQALWLWVVVGPVQAYWTVL